MKMSRELQVYKRSKGEMELVKELALPEGLDRVEDFASLLAKECGSKHLFVLFGEDKKHLLCEIKLNKKGSSVEYAFFKDDDVLRLRLFLKQNRGRFQGQSTGSHSDVAGMPKRKLSADLDLYW